MSVSDKHYKRRQPKQNRLSFTLNNSKPENRIYYFYYLRDSYYEFVFRNKVNSGQRNNDSRNIKLLGDKELLIRKHTSSSKKKNISYAPLLSVFLIAFGLSGIIYFSVSGASLDYYGPAYAESISVPVPAELEPVETKIVASKPTVLSIPKINLDVEVMEVGLNSDNTLETPPLFEKVAGWYNKGPTPGEIGPAVINAHVSTVRGPSVFWELGKLKPGNLVFVARRDGSKLKFKVNKIEQYPIDNFSTNKVYGNIDYPGLRLITCGGTFNEERVRFTHNTVVYASMVK